MSSTNKTTNYQLSQFVGTDIPSILNDYNGDMRKIDTAIKEVANATGSEASDIAELQTTVGRHTTEISGLTSNVNSVSGRVVGIEEVIPASATSSNKLITAQDIPEIPSVEQLEQDVASLQTNVGELQEEVSDMGGDVKAIQLCVPANASQSNKFATMADISGVSGEFDGELNVIQTFDPANYNDFGAMGNAIYAKLRELIGNLGNRTMKYVIALDYYHIMLPVTFANSLSHNFAFASADRGSGSGVLTKETLFIADDNASNYFKEVVKYANEFYPDTPSGDIAYGNISGYIMNITPSDNTGIPPMTILEVL